MDTLHIIMGIAALVLAYSVKGAPIKDERQRLARQTGGQRRSAWLNRPLVRRRERKDAR